MTKRAGRFVIQGHGCPLAEASRPSAATCAAVETLLAEVTGLPVRQRCERNGRIGCRFVIGDGAQRSSSR